MSSRITIMVIDDEPRHRELYSEALASSGLSVVTASSAEEAFQAIRKNTPDMIISDVKMPGMDGISFLREIRKSLPSLPFLLVTAFGEIKDAVEAL
ncbi:MAG: response regulator, partial [Victivallales bacterium]|nr:response regulator [Victivallales bacterium]